MSQNLRIQNIYDYLYQKKRLLLSTITFDYHFLNENHFKLTNEHSYEGGKTYVMHIRTLFYYFDKDFTKIMHDI